MSLGNLGVTVGADISGWTSSMDRAEQIARDKMGQSAGSVDDFRGSFLRASDDMQKASALMGSAMQAANDAIMASSAQSSAAIQGISDTAGKATFSSMSERVAEAIGDGVTAGVAKGSEAWDSFKEKSSTAATVAGIAIGAVLAGTIAGAIYTGYKVLSTTIGAISGMMDGSFYKSENIDSIIATNNELKKMQENFGISAIEAGALGDAMKRLQVDPGDYKAVYDGIEQSLHTNGEELDRLGVKYKAADGQFLDHTKVLQNAKDVLDTYTEGWDRNQAAAAMGMGSYAQIVQVLKVTSDQIETSKARLDEYQLGMSAGAQDAVAKYEKAMVEFNNETDLMSRGFKRAIGDAVMPAFTDLANLFKNGWPSIVQAFRVGTSTITGLGYAIADGIYIAAQSVMAAFDVMNVGIGSIVTALARLATGNVSGAGEALASGWEKAKDRLKTAGDKMVKQVMENDAKIKLATAADGRDASIIDSKVTKQQGKSYTPKPTEVKPSAISSASSYVKQDPFQSAENDVKRSQEGMDFVIANFDKFQGKVKESKEAMAQFDVTVGRFSDKQRAAAGFSPLSDSQKQAFIEENRQLDLTAEKLKTQTALREIDKSTAAFGFQEKQAINFRRQDVDWMGKSTLELAKLTEARRIDGAAASQIQAAKAKLGENGILPQKQIDDINAVATASKQAAADLIDQADIKSRDPYFNFTESVRKYGEEANNVGAQVGNALTNGFKSAEDAIVSFATTGKLSFSSFAQSVLADMARMQAKNFLASLTGNGNSSSFAGALGSGLFGLLGGASNSLKLGSTLGGSVTGDLGSDWASGLLGFAGGGDPPLNIPSMVGENGPELFVPKGSGTIIPNDQLRGGGGNNVTINQTNHIDSRTDMAQIQQMLARAKAQTKAEVADDMARRV
ncbi:MAG: phage tail tape measure C-terminal domain-containing protein [Janthinobacterium lividum]